MNNINNVLVTDSSLELFGKRRRFGLDAVKGLKAACQQLEQVASGAVGDSTVDKWISAGARGYTSSQLLTLVDRQRSFSLEEMVAAVAEQRGRYYPRLSTSEIAETKLLKRITFYGPSEMRERSLMISMATEAVAKQFGLRIEPAEAKKMGVAGDKIEWMAANPGTMGTNGKNRYLFDFNFIKHGEESVLDSDITQTRLHYLDLVANNHGHKADEVILVNFEIDENLTGILNSLKNMPGLNIETLKTVFGGKNPVDECLKLSFDRIVQSADIYREIIEAGSSLKQSVVKGVIPEPPKEIEMRLDSELLEEYTKLAKDAYGAIQLRHAAEAMEGDMKSRISGFCATHGIRRDFSPPYGGVHMRSHDRFNAEAADKYLVDVVGVDQSHTREPEINVDTLAAEFIRMGGDISKHTTFGSPNRRAIEEVAKKAGISIEQFYTRTMEAVVPPKTRGNFYEVTQDLRAQLKEISSDILKSEEVRRFIDHPSIADGDIQKRKPSTGPGM